MKFTRPWGACATADGVAPGQAVSTISRTSSGSTRAAHRVSIRSEAAADRWAPLRVSGRTCWFARLPELHGGPMGRVVTGSLLLYTQTSVDVTRMVPDGFSTNTSSDDTKIKRPIPTTGHSTV